MQSFLARKYQDGNGVIKDLQRAAYWYEKSAENGCDGAHDELGYPLLNGEGVGSDYSKACGCVICSSAEKQTYCLRASTRFL